MWVESIERSVYVKKTHVSKPDDINSFKSLVNKTGYNLTQSQSIILGNAMEDVINQCIKDNLNIDDIRVPGFSRKQRDCAWIDRNKQVIIYAEFKTNINLDTEKYKAVCKKIDTIHLEISKEYDEYEIKSYLVSLRHLSKLDVANKLINKYKSMNYGKIIGFDEFNKICGLELIGTYDNYITIIKNIVFETFFK